MGMSKADAYLNQRFIIVKFYDESNKKSDLLPIDLVPRSWVNKTKGDYVCKYPSNKDFEFVEKWTKEEKNPEKGWKTYRIELISGADDFKQGKRRMERAYATEKCASTDSETQPAVDEPLVFSKGATKKLLFTPTPMRKSRTKDNCALTMSKKDFGSQHSKFQSSDESSDDSSSNKSVESKKSTKHAIDKEITRSKLEYLLSTSSESDRDKTLESGVITNVKKTNVLPINRDSNKLELSDALVPFLNEKFEEQNNKLISAKDSILYNMRFKMDELKLAVVAISIPQVQKGSVSALVAAVQTPLPISKLEDFLEFENNLNEEPEKKDALIALFHFLCFEFTTAQKCIDNVLPRIFRKEVQGQYSGQGKKSRGVGKLDFSATATFTCFEVALIAKFGPCEGLKSKIGFWLANYKDRECGRKSRNIPS